MNVVVAGLGWWGKVMTSSQVRSPRFKVADFVDPKPAADAEGFGRERALTIKLNPHLPRRIPMNLYVIRRPNAWASDAELETVAGRSVRIGNEEMAHLVRWIRSYVVAEADGRLGTFCIYEAASEDAIRVHAARVGMPGDAIWSVNATVVVRPDPVSEAAAA